MTENEIRKYLGLRPGDGDIPERIIDSMRDVPYPHTDAEHMAAFKAFLRCAGRMPLLKPAEGV